MYGATSADGINWQGPYHIWSIPNVTPPCTGTWCPSGPFQTSPPALYGGGGDPSFPIGFAFPQYFGTAVQHAFTGGSANTYIYGVQVGKAKCDFSQPQLITHPGCSYNFFYDPSTGVCQDDTNYIYAYDEGFLQGPLSGPGTPLWTGAAGQELRAFATGNALGNDNPPIWYSVNQGTVDCVGANCQPPNNAGQWSNNGVGGAVNPGDVTSWLAKDCRYFNADTCGGNPYINLYRSVSPTSTNWCTEDPGRGGTGEWSGSAPSMTFFDGKLWLAWRGGGNDPDKINVASVDPCQIGWNGPSALSPKSLTFGSQNVGTTSAPQADTFSNTRYCALSISSISITGANSGDFAQTNNCGTSLAGSSHCTISVTFKPTATGTRTATLTVTDNAANSPQTAGLAGTGTTPPCQSNGTSCSSNSQCCSGYCAYGICGNPGCLKTGSTCTSNSQCCSNNCVNYTHKCG